MKGIYKRAARILLKARDLAQCQYPGAANGMPLASQYEHRKSSTRNRLPVVVKPSLRFNARSFN